ncbi:hypothetical protein [Aquibacillus koreensis]|nr:hypothetical protein [Aquibacillus koreensis]
MLSIKHAFKAGVYSFCLLLINQVYEVIAPYFMDSIINNHEQLGMTMGELVSIFTLIPKTMEMIAIAILVIGLYKMWSNKKQT